MNRLISIFKKIIHLPKKFLIIGIIVIAILGFFIFKFQNSDTQKLQFIEVKKQDIKSEVSSSGNLTGKNVVNLKFKSSGKLAYINVKVGDKIFFGQVVAGLDTQDLSIKLQQALNTYRDKQATAEKVEDDVKDHAKDETFTQKQLRTTAQATRDSAYDAVKEAQRAFQDTVITSPLGGLITQAPYVSGQVVSSSDVIAQVVDFSSFYFDTDIDEADIGKISQGAKAEITLDAYPDKVFEGSVNEIIPQTKTTSSGATVVTIRINLGELAINPINGLSGQAAIILAEVKDVLTIPQESLREDDTVVVQNGNQLQTKKVISGIKSDTDVEIKQGLKEDDKVLLNPPGGR